MLPVRSRVRLAPPGELAAEPSARAAMAALAGVRVVLQAQRQPPVWPDALAQVQAVQAHEQQAAPPESEDSPVQMASIWVSAAGAAAPVWRCSDWLAQGLVYELAVAREADEVLHPRHQAAV